MNTGGDKADETQGSATAALLCGDVQPLSDAQPMNLKSVTSLGTATTIIEIGPFRLLTDPAFDPAGTMYEFAMLKLGVGPLQHELILGGESRKDVVPPIGIDEVPPIDLLLLSHVHHADNFDDLGRQLSRQPAIRNVLTNKDSMRDLENDEETDIINKADSMDVWESCFLRAGNHELKITATPARHGPLVDIQRDHVTGFVLEWTNGSDTSSPLYITGDTILYRSKNPFRRSHRTLGIEDEFQTRGIGTIKTFFPHAGGVTFPDIPLVSETDMFTMVAAEARQLGEAIGAERVFPIHYSGWSHFREPERDHHQAFDDYPGEVIYLQPGETWAGTE